MRLTLCAAVGSTEIVALRAQGRPLRAIAEAMGAKGHRTSHEGVAGVLKAQGGRRS